MTDTLLKGLSPVCIGGELKRDSTCDKLVCTKSLFYETLCITLRRAFESNVVGDMFVPDARRKGRTKRGVMKNFLDCTSHQMLLKQSNKRYMVGRTCSMLRR